MPIIRSICWLALLAAALLCRLDAANAQGSPDPRQACAPDAMRLCSEFVPDVPKITACMKRKHAQLSQECRVAMRGGAHHPRVRRAHCNKSTHLCR